MTESDAKAAARRVREQNLIALKRDWALRDAFCNEGVKNGKYYQRHGFNSAPAPLGPVARADFEDEVDDEDEEGVAE